MEINGDAWEYYIYTYLVEGFNHGSIVSDVASKCIEGFT
jgi:hypothetical protein